MTRKLVCVSCSAVQPNHAQAALSIASDTVAFNPPNQEVDDNSTQLSFEEVNQPSQPRPTHDHNLPEIQTLSSTSDSEDPSDFESEDEEVSTMPGKQFPLLCLDQSIYPSPDHPPNITWFNSFIGKDKPAMPQEFNINQRPPFQDPMETLGVQPYDVFKIKNVPYGITIPEIKHYVGRLTNSPLIKDHQQGYPVHIIMERPTGKTLDCFVELQHKGAAQAAYNRATQAAISGKPIKMGTRHVDVEVSSEGELCATLFPRANSTVWDPTTGVPTIVLNEDPFSEGFQAFFTIEEMNSVVKHAKTPQKYSLRYPQRVYESMMSTLYKFPWHVPQHYSVNARNLLWNVYMELLRVLVVKVQPTPEPSRFGQSGREVGLGHSLLMDYIFCGLNVQMFSLRQKFMIIYAAGPLGAGFPLPRQAMGWPFQSLIPSPNATPEVLDHWLRILDAGFHKFVMHNFGHMYGTYIKLGRDESGLMKIELTEAGLEISFRDLISMEKGLMECLVEQGRVEYCKGYEIAYRPLKLWGPSTIATASSSSHDTTSHDNDLSDNLVHKFGRLSPFTSDEQTLSDDDGNSMRAICNTSHVDEDDAAQHLDPQTPAFIPTQPWANVSASSGRVPAPPANTPQYLYGKTTSSATSNPSLSSPRDHYDSHRSSGAFAASNARPQPYRASDNSQWHDPFNGKISPHHSLGRSFQAKTGSTSSLPGSFRQSGEDTSYASSPQSSSQVNKHAKPVLSNIWSSIVGNGDKTPAHVGNTPARRSTSASAFFSGTREIPARRSVQEVSATGHVQSPAMYQRSHRSASSTSAPLTGYVGDNSAYKSAFDGKGGTNFSKPRPSYAAVVKSQSDSNLRQDSGSSSLYASPARGAGRRTSSARNMVQVHATISEECEVSAAESNGGDDDNSTDAGGVSLRAK